jgi:hypothetical protein
MSKQLDDKAAEALEKLGHTPEEIAELAEKQKALPQEENVVEKEETTPERETLWAQLGKALGIGTKEAAPIASEPEEAEKTEVAPAAPAEPAETEKKEGGELDAQALLAALGTTVAKNVGEMVKTQLDERDKRIAALEELVKGLNMSVEEKVAARLADVPPDARVAPSMVGATAAPESPSGFTFGRQPANQQDFYPELIKSITQATEDTVGNAKLQM